MIATRTLIRSTMTASRSRSEPPCTPRAHGNLASRVCARDRQTWGGVNMFDQRVRKMCASIIEAIIVSVNAALVC